MTAVAALLTAEEYGRLPDNGQPTELVRGRIVPLNMPYPRHGEICSKVDRIVGFYVDEQSLGRLVSNDSGVITERGPDTVRGADVAFYSYQRIPPGPLPQRYLDVLPELVFEVRSPSDRWVRIIAKVGEYLTAGVTYVVVLDEPTHTAHVFSADHPVRIVGLEEEFSLPNIFAGFRIQVRQFFE